MSSSLLKSVLVSPTVLGITLLLATGVMAEPKSKSAQISGSSAPLVAANDIEIISDEVKPGSWQYTALQGMADKYGCNANLNDKAVSQVDFARGLNACLGKVEPMLAKQPSSVTTEDLTVLKKLTQEFRAQLSEVDNRINQSDRRIAQAQGNQFSTTTKLKGEAIFNVTGAVTGADPNNTVFGNRVRLLFESSFSGKDKLWTRLAMGNQVGVNSNLKNGATPEGTQTSEGSTNNLSGLDWLAYQFPWQNTNVYVAATGGIHVDYAPTYGGGFEDATGGSGALTIFGESSPIYKIGGGAGVGTNFPIADTGLTSVSVGYLAAAANSPAPDKGFFNGDYAALGQLNFKVSDQLDAGLTYVNSYHASTPLYSFGLAAAGTGTTPANLTTAGTTAGGATGRTSANSYGAQFTYKASDTLAFNGFAMNTRANKSTGTEDIWSYGGGVSLPNFDGKGGLLGLIVGAEPYVGGVGSTPIHIEGFYKYKLSDNLSITPGLIYLTAPNQVSGNGALIGVVRTTFLF
jgi:hypothetical protein